jgi:hypothetical protein
VPQDPNRPSRAYPEASLQVNCPKTYAYLKRFEKELRNRSGYKQILSQRKQEFYGLMDIDDYTFAPWKVVWTRIGSIQAAVVSSDGGKVVIPQETITLVPCNSSEEAHYICAIVNSAVFQFAAESYSQKGGKSMGTMHLLDHIHIPCYDPNMLCCEEGFRTLRGGRAGACISSTKSAHEQGPEDRRASSQQSNPNNAVHRRLAELSMQAHQLMGGAPSQSGGLSVEQAKAAIQYIEQRRRRGGLLQQTADEIISALQVVQPGIAQLEAIEAEIDQLAAQVWGLTAQELEAIRQSLLQEVDDDTADRGEGLYD